ncbi:MAG: phospholipase D family protein [Dehalococcoidia bacterium]
MRTTTTGILIGFMLAVLVGQVAAPPQPDLQRPEPTASESGIDLHFSPNGGAAEAVIHEIRQAHESILVAAYAFTSAPIAEALLRARDRGVEVVVIMDRLQRTNQYSSSTFFVNQGIPVYIAVGPASYHHKVMLIDDGVIITGSMNFTKAGDERNAENLLIIRDKPELMKAYTERIEVDLDRAERLESE